MFKRPTKAIPKGAFIPFLPRILAIIHLSLAFTWILSVGQEPFMGEQLACKKRLYLFQNAFGEGQSTPQAKLMRNKERFASLSPERRRAIESAHTQLIETMNKRSFSQKLTDSISLILFNCPLFDRMWAILSVILSILLLMRFPGSVNALWLLPIVTLAAAFDNAENGRTPPGSEERLFPSESYLIEHYMREPLAKDIFMQQGQLAKAWQRYLAAEWADSDALDFPEQVESGEYAFTIRRLESTMETPVILTGSIEKRSHLTWALYVLWNFLFASIAFLVNEIRPYSQKTA